MKRNKFRHKYAKEINYLIGFIVVQILIVIFCILSLDASKPLSYETIEQVEICVDDINYVRVLSEYQLNIFSDETKYTFAASGQLQPYSNSELYETIEIGDRIFIAYYKNRGVLGTYNWVVDARTESEIFRSIEIEEKSKKGAFIGIIIIFAVIEIFYIIVLCVYIMLNYNLIKIMCKKRTKIKKS